MSLQETTKLVASIKENIQQKITHHYLKKYIELPFIDEDRIILLLNSMVDRNIPENEVEKLVASAMLIQIALDTHEKVTNFGGDLKKRQLLVLSGDYYSGLYYKILAEIDNIPLIKVLAEGIKAVNEYKISLYQNKEMNIDEYMQFLKKAESTIVTKFCHFFESTHLSPLVEEFLLMNRLLKEQEIAIQGASSVLFDTFVKYLFPAKHETFQQLTSEKRKLIIKTFENYIAVSRNRLKVYLKELKNPNLLLGQRIKILVMERPLRVSNLYLEEG